MQNVRLLFDVATTSELIGVLLGLAENHGTTMFTTVDLENATNGGGAILVAALDGQVLDRGGGLEARVAYEVDELKLVRDVLLRGALHPWWTCG